MELKDLMEHWERLGSTDPYWAILTSPDKMYNRWDIGSFFATGKDKVGELLAKTNERGISVTGGSALDFGCGVGRLTQALAEKFQEVDGVDISPSMIGLARKFNRHGARCRYHVNSRDDLSLFPSQRFDFILCYIVLQHVGPTHALSYIREFVRILRPGGLAVFQLPTRLREPEPEPVGEAPPPLPPGGFSAQIELLGMPSRFASGCQVVLRVRVRNTSMASWPNWGDSQGRGLVQLGNHWLDEKGGLLQNDDARARLQETVEPEKEVFLELAVRPPSPPGKYRLVLDMVQENVAWFQQRGNKPWAAEVDVAARSEAASPALSSPTPSDDHRMDMFGVPEANVRGAVAEAGGRVLAAEEDNSAGAEWESRLYFVTR